MVKLTGKAKAAFLARMAAGKTSSGKTMKGAGTYKPKAARGISGYWNSLDWHGKQYLLTVIGIPTNNRIVSKHVGSWDKKKKVFYEDMNFNELKQFAPEIIPKLISYFQDKVSITHFRRAGKMVRKK